MRVKFVNIMILQDSASFTFTSYWQIDRRIKRSNLENKPQNWAPIMQ